MFSLSANDLTSMETSFFALRCMGACRANRSCPTTGSAARASNSDSVIVFIVLFSVMCFVLRLGSDLSKCKKRLPCMSSLNVRWINELSKDGAKVIKKSVMRLLH